PTQRHELAITVTQSIGEPIGSGNPTGVFSQTSEAGLDARISQETAAPDLRSEAVSDHPVEHGLVPRVPEVGMHGRGASGCQLDEVPVRPCEVLDVVVDG